MISNIYITNYDIWDTNLNLLQMHSKYIFVTYMRFIWFNRLCLSSKLR